MNFHAFIKKLAQDRQGAAMVVVALSLVALFGFVALAIDIGHLYVTRNELQNIADGAALAATRQLGQFYKTMSYDEQQTYICDSDDAALIISQAQSIGSQNRAAEEYGITIPEGDIVIGIWQPATSTLQITLSHPTAVRVRARRDEVANNPISTFFASVIGTDLLSVNAMATAALTGQGSAGPGNLELPVGISKWWYEDPGYCNDTIAFSPANSPDSCAGWTSFEISPSNDNTIRNILNEEEGYTNDDITSGETNFEFIGGDLSTPTFDALLELFRRKGHDLNENGEPITVNGEILPDHCCSEEIIPDNGPPASLYAPDGVTRLLYPDGTERNVHEWETSVVVYDSTDCSNPNQTQTVVGFSEIRMFDVREAPEKTIKAEVLCNYVDQGDSRGSGGQFGKLGSIPGLVQ